MTYEELEKLITKILTDTSVKNKDKAKAVVSKIREIEDLSSYYEIHFLPIYDSDGSCVNKTESVVSIYGDSMVFDETQLTIYKDTKEVFCCSPALVYYVNKK